MDDTRARLAGCFTAVFPDLAPGDVERATPQTVGAWDSLANVTLVMVVEEEFGLEFPAEDLQELTSFDSMLQYLRAATSGR